MDKKALIKALRDTAQSASNTIASGVSAPVDLIAAGLRKMGVPVPENALGGSRWMEDVGLTVPVQDGIPKTVGETLGMIVPMAATAKAPQIAAGANRAIENAMAPATLNTPGFAGQRGAIVWHGSPHKFDKFDSSKIGTGEGAQAYGHGLYFAESPNVAKQYADELSSKIDVNGRPLFQSNKIVGSTGNSDLDDYLVSNLGNIPAARRNLLSDIRYVRPENREAAKEMQKTLADLRKANVSTTNTGNIYKVDLPDEAIAKMLDWDKPLSQQAPEVRAALLKSGDKTIINAINDTPVNRGDYWEYGGNTYATKREALEDATGFNITSGRTNLGDTPQAVSLRLNELGIPGIRYLDQGSRGAGAGTSNFVVFPGNENMLRILERNNQPLGLMGIK
jgi:hypothetical protein